MGRTLTKRCRDGMAGSRADRNSGSSVADPEHAEGEGRERNAKEGRARHIQDRQWCSAAPISFTRCIYTFY